MIERVLMNVCMVGHGMTGIWHSNALNAMDCCLHTLVGRRPQPTEEFAERYGYRRWTISLEEALLDDEIDVAILTGPSETHAEHALAALAAGKHTLVEIPIAMCLGDSERVVETAHQLELTLGVVHPMRVRPEMVALRDRIKDGSEHIRHVGGRFFINRLENVGATGYARSWTDNLLWHHTAHLVDFGLWMLNEPVRKVVGFMPFPDLRTGIPMDAFVAVETEQDQTVVCTGSYYGRERIFETLVVTDQDTYRLDVFGSILTTVEGEREIAPEPENCGLVTRDFVKSVEEGRQPAISGDSVLPAMRVLQEVQDQWDMSHGPMAIPGRQIT
ncbi:MAG TPA: Gfo/Idh/MocA family oxidoreductase [Anaerolineales bacterium]|nr:Gfo/Idh/MocA family oxidoreductase [Anaerolineales bacterium]